MGHATQWKYRERQRLCGVHETSAGGPSREAPDWTGACRCGIFRETFLGAFGARGITLHYCGQVNGGGPEDGSASHTLNGLAWSGTGSGGGGSGGEFTELAGSEAPFCLSAPGDLGAARGTRETLSGLSGIYLSTGRHPCAVCGRNVTRMYGGRADSENRIKELKEDLSLDTFCLKSFDATDAAFRMGCVLYNLLTDFRETLLPRAWFERRLRAVRDFVFVVGADLIAQGRRVRIRLAMPQPERAEFLRRLRIVSQGVPIAAQLEWSVEDHNAAQPDNILSPIPLLTLISPQNSSQ